MYIVNGQPVALSESVSTGQVTLDPSVGVELRSLLREQIDQVDSWLERAGRLARPAPLGMNPVSDAMAAKFESRADGDQLSFLNVMAAYRGVLQQTHDTVSTAIENFEQVDDEHRVALRRIGGE